MRHDRPDLAHPLIFVHIEKTGGSSIRLLLQEQLFPDARQGRGPTIVLPGYVSGQPGDITDSSSVLRGRLINTTACAVAFLGHFRLRALSRITRDTSPRAACLRLRA